MSSRMTPMIHVPDVRKTALWYEAIGFALVSWHVCDAPPVSSGSPPEGAGLDWALLRWDRDELMLNVGGVVSTATRREVDLYIYLGPDVSVDALFDDLRVRTDIVEPPHDTFHGARQLIIRDLNGFWITFAEPLEG